MFAVHVDKHILPALYFPKPQRAYERVSEDKMVSLRQMGVHISEEKSQAVEKGLSVQIEDRYQQMADLYYDLYGETLSGEMGKQS